MSWNLKCMKYECFMISCCQDMPPCKSYTAVHLFFSVLVFNLQPHPPGMDPGARCHGMKLNPTGYLRSEYESPLIKSFQDIDYHRKAIIINGVLDFNL